MNFPEKLQINAWTGDPGDNEAPVASTARKELLKRGPAVQGPSLAPQAIDIADWSHPDVGWGLVLADDDALAPAMKATANDAPPPLRELCAKRNNAPVLRYNPDGPAGTLMRYYADGGVQEVSIAALNYGTGRGRIPRYLLIWAGPHHIPWSVQYELQTGYFVGRLDLEGDGLANYVTFLMGDWAQAGLQLANTTVWAVDHGAADITRLMRDSVALPLHKAFKTDQDPAFQIGAGLLSGNDATCAALMEDLAARRPSFVLTSSHGATGPLSDVAQMRSRLGLMVDNAHALLDPEALLGAWKPSGAIWFAQACCSAGSAERTAYKGLVDEDSAVGQILDGVAQCGAMISPLPRALLGAQAPLRAFVGHVEPTFDWTLRHPRTGQFLSRPLIRTFYDHLYLGKPIGMALAECRIAAASLNESYRIAADQLADGADTAGDVLFLELMSKDWRALVLLGDPTCRISPPTQNR